MVDTLNRNLSAACHDPSKVPDVSRGLPMHVFNYWKDVLCVKSTAGFEDYQTFRLESVYSLGSCGLHGLGFLQVCISSFVRLM